MYCYPVMSRVGANAELWKNTQNADIAEVNAFTARRAAERARAALEDMYTTVPTVSTVPVAVAPQYYQAPQYRHAAAPLYHAPVMPLRSAYAPPMYTR